MDDKELETRFGVTADELNAWAGEFESGTWPDGKTVVLGRPRLADEEIKTVTFKMPQGKLVALDRLAAQCGESRSDYLRGMVDRALSGA
jgi:hypothetical protein